MNEQPAAPRTRVLVADDELIVRRGVRMILENAGDLDVVGEARDGREAVRLVRELSPDVVLMDIRMPELDGIAATRQAVSLGARVLVLTTYDSDENLYEALRAGAGGFVLKTSHPDDLAHAVRVVARGDALVGPSVVRRLVERHVRPARSRPAWADALTEREREVLDLMVTGLSNAEISAALFLGEGTVKTHVARVLAKMRVRDRLQAVVTAYESGYVER